MRSILLHRGSVGASRTWGRPVQSQLTKNKWRYDDVTHAEDEEDPSKQSAIFVDGAAPPLFVRVYSQPSSTVMPRKFVSQGKLTVDRTALEEAFKHRVETGCSIRAACKQFDVKVMTLQVN
ncbi:hypothetical protein FHG87_014762 [Trinorchestia longiramus]|nr:hypothetical protein FHG87_014762 [Trinorchestia longiramus]